MLQKASTTTSAGRKASESSDEASPESPTHRLEPVDQDQGVITNPDLDDLIRIISNLGSTDQLDDEIPLPAPVSKRASFFGPARPGPGPLQRRNAVRTSSSESIALSTTSQDSRRLSASITPLSVDKSRHLSAPAHTSRSASDPGHNEGPASMYSVTSALTVHKAESQILPVARPLPQRPRSASEVPQSSLFSPTSASTCYSPSPTLFSVALPSSLLASPQSVGYTDSDFVPLATSAGHGALPGVPPPLSTPLGLSIPPPVFAVQTATPLTPVRHRDTFDSALVEAKRSRMSALFLVQRKERRKSWTPGDPSSDSQDEERPGRFSMGKPRNRKEQRRSKVWEEEPDEELEEWEKELRQIDAEQKIRTLENARRRSMEFKDWSEGNEAT